MASITITVKLFAIYQEVCGQESCTLFLPPHSTVATVLDHFLDKYPSLIPWRSVTRFGVNCQFVAPDWVLENGDEVVFIPPVSGG